MKRKFLIYGLIVALFFTCFSFSVNAEEWYDETVNYAIKHNLVNGYPDGSFMPYNNVSKGELIKLVVARYMDPVDLSVYEHWAIPYVQFAEQNSIIPVGMYNTSNLDQPASRKEICYMLIQACRNIAYKPVLEDTDMVLDFEDLNEQNKEAINENGLDYAQAMRLCYAMGIIKGYPTQEEYIFTREDGTSVMVVNNLPKLVKPNENVTRAETATMVARTYFSQYRQYTLIKREGNELPSNAADFVETYTYMPKSFYEAGKDTFFKYLPDENPVNLFSKISLDDGRGKSRIEGGYDALFNISYKMSDDEWNTWKEEILVFNDIPVQTSNNELDLDEYIQFIKDNKIVVRGGFIVDPSTLGNIETKGIVKQLKGIGQLYIENPNNVDDISLLQFEWLNRKLYINKSFKQGYVLCSLGALQGFTTNYIQYCTISTNMFSFSY